MLYRATGSIHHAPLSRPCGSRVELGLVGALFHTMLLHPAHVTKYVTHVTKLVTHLRTHTEKLPGASRLVCALVQTHDRI